VADCSRVTALEPVDVNALMHGSPALAMSSPRGHEGKALSLDGNDALGGRGVVDVAQESVAGRVPPHLLISQEVRSMPRSLSRGLMGTRAELLGSRDSTRGRWWLREIVASRASLALSLSRSRSSIVLSFFLFVSRCLVPVEFRAVPASREIPPGVRVSFLRG